MVLCSLVACAAAVLEPLPQQNPASDNANRLKASVEIGHGTTTLADLCKQLSLQTGIRIEAAPYLANHRLTVFMPKVSAHTAISMLAELGGWQVEELSKEHLLFRRSKPSRSIPMTSIPAAVRSSMPTDYQAFLGLGSSSRASLALDYNSPDIANAMSGRLTLIRDIKKRVGDARQSAALQFAQSIAASLATDGRLAYSQMNTVQKRAFVNTLTLDCLEGLLTKDTWEALNGEIPSYIMRPEDTFLRYDGQSIGIEMPLLSGARIGFGAQAAEPQVIKARQP